MQAEQLQKGLKAHRALRVPGRRWLAQAAVAIVLREDPARADLELLFTRRVKREGDPWSGHISFPGGRKQASDPGTLATALRETAEETGLWLSRSQCCGRLSDLVTRQHGRRLPMLVTPYVFVHQGDAELRFNHEITDAFWAPLAFFRRPGNRQTMYWRVLGLPLPLPSYVYEDNRIWGLTLIMLRRLLKVVDSP